MDTTILASRRRFLSGLGQAGAAARRRVVAGRHRLRAGQPRAGARVHPAAARPAWTSTGACSARSSSISGRAVYTGVYEPGSPPLPTPRASAPTSCARSRSWACRSSATRAATSSPATTGSTASGRRRSARRCSSGRGTRSRRTSSAPTTSSTGAALVGTEPLLGMNFGTGSVEMAVAYVEYCNLDRGTKWSDLRRSHGYEQPHNVRYWCLGNEMDGNWQIGQLQAREYGRKARDVAKQMRVIDPKLQLIACGSSGTGMSHIPDLGSRSARGVLRPGGRHLAARLLRQHAAADGQQRRALSGDEPRHGSADSRGRGGLRLRAGAPQVGQAPVAVVRRVERLVPGAQRRRGRTAAGSSRRSCSRRSTTSRTRCSSAASSTRCCGTPIVSASAASRSS